MNDIIDIHTHRQSADRALVCIDPLTSYSPAGRPFAVAIHPWQSDCQESYIIRLYSLATDPLCLAIGETGLDLRRGPDIQKQQTIFERHIELSESLRKPLIIHNVGASAMILAAHRSNNPSQPWIIHGFRGKPQLAKQLLDHGMHISIGPRFNPSTVSMLPDKELLLETDDTQDTSITDIAATIATLRSVNTDHILSVAADNASRLLNL